MGIHKEAHFDDNDVFVDYDFEEVMFRWDHVGRKVFRKFYGQDESSEAIPSDNRLYNDALQFGDEITREEYARGLPIKK
jgi:hypothetical protein